jgi:hypothetical protein
MALAIGLVLAGCESATAGDAGGQGPAGDTVYGPGVLTGENVTAADLAAAFANTDAARAVVRGNVILASSVKTVEGVVPAGRKLIALSSTSSGLAVGTENSHTLVIEGELELGAGVQFDAAGGAITATAGTISFGGDGKVTLKSDSGIAVKDAALLDKVSAAPDATDTVKSVGVAAAGVVAALGATDTVTVKDLGITGSNNTTIAGALTTGKTLVLTGTGGTVGADFSLGAAAGKLLVNGTLSIGGAHTLTGATGGDAAANITVPAAGILVLGHNDAALAGKIKVDGTVSVGNFTVATAIPTTVDLTGGTLKATGSGVASVKLADANVSIGTVYLGDALTLTGTSGKTVTIGTLTKDATARTFTAVDGTVNITTAVGNTSALTVAGTGATVYSVGEVTGAGGLTLGTNATLTTSDAVTVDDDSNITGPIAGFGASSAAVIAQINKISGGTVEVSDAAAITGLSAAAEFTRTDAIEFGSTFATESGQDATFNGPVVFNGNVTVTGTETLTLLGNSKLLGSGKTITATTGSVVVGGTVGEATNKVTLAKVTLTNASETDGEIDLNGATGVVNVRWDTAGSKLELAKTGTIVTAGTGKVLVGTGLQIGGAVTAITASEGGGTAGVTFAAAAATSTITQKTQEAEDIFTLGTAANGIVFAGLNSSPAVITLTKSAGGDLPVVFSGIDVIVPSSTANNSAGAILELSEKASILLGTSTGSLKFQKGIAAGTAGSGALKAASGAKITAKDDGSYTKLPASAGFGADLGTDSAASPGAVTAAIASANSSGEWTLADISSKLFASEASAAEAVEYAVIDYDTALVNG